jgi:predicted signal transduction protein with EAL and GGDEF domain
LLVGVAQRLRSAVRVDDLVARLGGDEFAVILANVSDDMTMTVIAERIISSLNEPLAVVGRDVQVGCSIGVTVTDTFAVEGTDLLRRADIAMYQAKARGKNSYIVYDPEMDALARQKLDGERDLRNALDGDQFAVAFQPLVSLKTGAIIGAEALVRWHHPVRGVLSPAEFLPLAEETGLIVQIGVQTLRTACRVAVEANWTREDEPLVVSVNLSPAQLADAAIVDTIQQVLAESGLAATCLILEITESTIVRDTDALIATLHRLRAIGVQIAIDDFGMGYSSLSHLRHFPVDIVKIDRQFVTGLGHDFNDTIVVSGVNGIAHAMGLAVVAEGIETAEQIVQLFELGCDIGQGYYISSPCPAVEYLAMVSDTDWPAHFTRNLVTWLRGSEPQPDERDEQYGRMIEQSQALSTMWLSVH